MITESVTTENLSQTHIGFKSWTFRILEMQRTLEILSPEAVNVGYTRESTWGLLKKNTSVPPHPQG